MFEEFTERHGGAYVHASIKGAVGTRNMYDVVTYTQHNSHYLKSIKRLLIRKGCSDVADKSKQLGRYLKNNTHIQLSVEDWRKIRKKIYQNR